LGDAVTFFGSRELAVLFALFLLGLSFALGSSLGGIVFPIAELGNCESEASCREYCDAPAHKLECDAFVEAHGLDEKLEALSSIEYPVAGLGNCASRSECEAYCEEPENFVACIDFAEAHGLIDPSVAEEDRKMARLIAEGKTPGKCQSERECISYCKTGSHFEECVRFLEENSIVPEEEIAMIRKLGSFDFQGPGGCQSEESCKSYCMEDSHFDECVRFLEENGIIPKEELEMVKRIGSFRGPGGCVMDECEAYCDNQDNFETCLEFAHAHGLVSDEEFEIAKKTGGIGPGGCRGREECEAFCENPDNMPACVDFACEHGFMGSEECAEAKEMIARGINIMQPGPGGCKGKEECEAYCSSPENMAECMSFACEHGLADSEECARGMGMMEEGMMRREAEAGPGGCMGEAECGAYCRIEEHAEECFRFACERGFISQEECTRGFIGNKEAVEEPLGEEQGMGHPDEHGGFPADEAVGEQAGPFAEPVGGEPGAGASG
jgi:hypothetical protein